MSDIDVDADLTLNPASRFDRVPIRALTTDDLDAVTRIDAHIMGRPRRDYLRVKLHEAMKDTRVRVSLGAEVDGMLAGFLMGRVYYGEFGTPEPVALLDTIGVDPDRARQGIGRALYDQFRVNVGGLGISAIRSHADWNNWPVIRFLEGNGFTPIPHVTMEARIDNR